MVNFRLGGNFHFIMFVCANIGALGATPHPSRLRVPPSPKIREKADL